MNAFCDFHDCAKGERRSQQIEPPIIGNSLAFLDGCHDIFNTQLQTVRTLCQESRFEDTRIGGSSLSATLVNVPKKMQNAAVTEL
jgi:hypothetical protein